ncbi:cell division protein FtsL [Hahella ganghwensis]|uniref:cell division protein FtsL n=1 Tax=Hahella ganghwensis TaxID=286420 RepID=UPI00036B453C|nr:cell division protein FtsL [Hahella ganghwensis]
MILIRNAGQATPMVRRSSSAKTVSVWPSLMEWWKETCYLMAGFIKGRTIVTVGLMLALVVSGIAAAYAVHLNRQLFIELQGLQQQKDRYEREWTQLLLEESAWSAHSRVEQIASKQFGMSVPRTGQVEIVR